jgi:hypothetical protein
MGERSMGLAGSEYGLFLKQLGAGHLELALTHAADLGKVPLRDALRICELMAPGLGRQVLKGGGAMGRVLPGRDRSGVAGGAARRGGARTALGGARI